eukprot:957403-Amphidinium_carterae.1
MPQPTQVVARRHLHHPPACPHDGLPRRATLHTDALASSVGSGLALMCVFIECLWTLSKVICVCAARAANLQLGWYRARTLSLIHI